MPQRDAIIYRSLEKSAMMMTDGRRNRNGELAQNCIAAFIFLTLPAGVALLGASLYAWGWFGLDNTPQPFASGMYLSSHPYGQATYAYAAANLMFVEAVVIGAIGLIGLYTSPKAPSDI